MWSSWQQFKTSRLFGILSVVLLLLLPLSFIWVGSFIGYRAYRKGISPVQSIAIGLVMCALLFVILVWLANLTDLIGMPFN